MLALPVSISILHFTKWLEWTSGNVCPIDHVSFMVPVIYRHSGFLNTRCPQPFSTHIQYIAVNSSYSLSRLLVISVNAKIGIVLKTAATCN
jgi:hypothetical protein